MNVVGSLRSGSSCRLSSTNARGWFWHAFCLFYHAGECKNNSIAELRSMKLQCIAIFRIDRPCQAHTQRLTSSSFISVRIRSRPRSCATAADAAAQPALPVRDRRPHSRAASAAGGPAATRSPDQHARHGRRRRRHSRDAAEYILALHRNGGGAGAAGYYCAAACGGPHAGQPAVLQVHFSQA